MIIGKSESGDTLKMPKEKWDEYNFAITYGDYEKMEEIEFEYYYPDED